MATASDTRTQSYTDRLRRQGSVWWKRLLDVQRPYRWNLRRMKLGFVLDVGCGLGRNLANLGGKGAAVGVDHNSASVAEARSRGFEAYLPEDLEASEHARPGRFDALLFSHVLEHMTAAQAEALLRSYLPYLRTGGRVVMITPQEAGFHSDPTHVELVDLDGLERLARAAGLRVLERSSFPFPRPVGRVFRYNEFVVVAEKAA